MKVPRWYDPIPSARKTKKKASSRSRWIVAILIFVVLPVVVTVVQLVRPYQSTETPVPGINTFVSVGDVDFLFRRLEFCKACGPESGVTLDADYTGKISKLLAVYKTTQTRFLSPMATTKGITGGFVSAAGSKVHFTFENPGDVGPYTVYNIIDTPWSVDLTPVVRYSSFGLAPVAK